MNAVDLQDKLACLARGEILLLVAAEIERAFPFHPTAEIRREAVADLAWLYRCDVAFRGPDENQALFTRHDDPWPMNSR